MFTPSIKRCHICGQIKHITEFYKHPTISRCKDCWNSYTRKKSKEPKYRARRKISLDVRKSKSPRDALRCSLYNRSIRINSNEPSITLDELMDLFQQQKGKCALSGITMTWGNGKNTKNYRPLPTSMTMDRIDPPKGYVSKNIRLVCHCFHSMRGQMSDTEMYEMMRRALQFIDKNDSILMDAGNIKRDRY